MVISMTKSVKEKTRLANIRYCKANNIPVSSELLKINISYNNEFNKNSIFFKNRKLTSKNKAWIKEQSIFFRQMKETLENKAWIKEHFSTCFDNIKEKIIPIARRLDIYDFKVSLDLCYTLPDFGEKVEICTKLSLYSHKYYIGIIALNNRVVHTRSTRPVELTFGQLITPDVIAPLVDDYKSNWTQFPYVIRFNSYFNADFSKMFPTSEFSKLMSSFKALEKHYFQKLKVDGYLSVSYTISDDIDIDIFDKSIGAMILNNFQIPKTCYLKNPKRFDKISFLKILLYLGLIKTQISETDLIIENIEEIETLIKLSNY